MARGDGERYLVVVPWWSLVWYNQRGSNQTRTARCSSLVVLGMV